MKQISKSTLVHSRILIYLRELMKSKRCSDIHTDVPCVNHSCLLARKSAHIEVENSTNKCAGLNSTQQSIRLVIVNCKAFNNKHFYNSYTNPFSMLYVSYLIINQMEIVKNATCHINLILCLYQAATSEQYIKFEQLFLAAV